MSDHLIVVSSDCHAGLHIADYKPYVESKYHEVMDMAVPVQVELTAKAEESFLIKEINDAWREPIQKRSSTSNSWPMSQPTPPQRPIQHHSSLRRRPWAGTW